MRSWLICMAESIGERIERSLPTLGIAALEDKVVQQAEDFLGFSRPGRSQHQALYALWVGIRRKKVNWILDADPSDLAVL